MKTKIGILLATVAVAAIGIGIWFSQRHNSQTADKQAQSSHIQADSQAPVIQLNIAESAMLLSQENKSLEIGVKSDNYKDIVRIDYLVDGAVVARSNKAPFVVDIDISSMTVGDHSLQAFAYDAAGNIGKSEVFTFTITAASKPVEPSNPTSKAIIRQSMSTQALKQSVTNGSSSSSDSSGDNGSGDGDNGGGPGDTTPWPDTPTALICGNSALLSGPTTAPAGAVVVPAGDNSGINFGSANTTYWFASGTHTLGTDQFDQILPGNNATFIGAPGAVLDGQHLNNYAFTQHATNVKIQYLTIQNFVTPQNEGTVNHDSGVGWTIEYNTVQNNKGGAVFAGTNNTLRYNCLKNNGQYGFQVYSSDAGGPTNVLLDHNEISGNNTDDWETQQPGCGCTGGGKFWDAHNVTITNNYVHNNLSVGLWADTNDTDFLVDGNYISDNQGQGLFYEISYNMIVRNNNLDRNSLDSGPNDNSFPSGAIYLSESGGDNRVAGRTANIDIYDNQFTDNWAGVVLWENADRFCNSPANTSTGTCTLVNPAATLTTCNDPALGGSIDQEPYKSDCRWKTQNVKVHNNVFSINKANITGCTTNSSCGFQGVFSNVGSFPSWSPYMGTGIQQAIAFNQNNLFSSNTYLGDWNFMAKTQGSRYNFAIWQGAQFNQDVGSTYNGQPHLVVANALDDDTATLEGSIGKWTSWFSSSVSQSTVEAHSGTHSLKVSITDPFGWGVQLTNSGFPITPNQKTISFWAKLGSGTNLGATMEVHWLDENLNTVGSTDSITLSPLTTSWQQVSHDFTPPANAVMVNINFVHSTGTTNNALYLDDIVIGDK